MNTQHQYGQQRNYFYDKIKKNLDLGNDEYQKIFGKYINTEDENVVSFFEQNFELRDFVAFGDYAFISDTYVNLVSQKILGLVNRKDEQTQNHLTTVKNNLTDCKIKTTDFESFLFAIHKIAKQAVGKDKAEIAEKLIVKLRAVCDEMKNKISTKAIISTELRRLLKDLFFDSGLIIDIEYVESLHEIKNKIVDNELMYHDLIIINSFIMDNGIFAEKGDVEKISVLIGNEDFKAVLDMAYDAFESQKYAVIYYDAILTMFEKLSIVVKAKHIYLDTVLRDDDETFKISVKLNEAVENVDNADATKINHKTYSLNANDSVHAYIRKTMNNVGIDGLIDDADYPIIFMRAVDAIAGSSHQEEMLQTILQAIQIPFENKDRLLWPVGQAQAIEAELNSRISDLNIDFEEKIKQYISDIPEKQKDIVVSSIDDLIKETLILNNDSEVKIRGMLIEQIHENKIHTYKQLNQFIEVIEKCKVKTQNAEDYIKFINYIKSNKSITDKIKLSMECKEIQETQNYYLVFTKYIRHISPKNN